MNKGLDVLYEVPLSHGLFIYEHEGCGEIYSKQTHLLAEYYSLDCWKGTLSGIDKIHHPKYYIDSELLKLTFDIANYGDGDANKYCDKGLNDFKKWDECGECICSDCVASEVRISHLDYPLVSDWWTLDDILTVKQPISLKNFNPKVSNYHSLIECKIKHIGKPQMNDKFKRYEQKITLYDDSSLKEIKSQIIGDDVFFEDEFGSGDTVIVFGDYFVTHKIPFQIHSIKRVKKSEKKKPVSRNDFAWKKAVKERDGVCQCCGDDKSLEAHHIFAYANQESLRDTVENGITLCKWCHRKYHSHYGNGDEVNPLTLNKFLMRFGRDDYGS